MQCALCKRDAKLQESHIIPKLVYTRIKTHKNSRFRSLDNINVILQNGEKRPMLCHECEERFSFYEKKFADKFIDKYLDEHNIPNFTGTWLDNYILSVAWRILWDDLYRLDSFKDSFVRNLFEDFCDELGEYLLSPKFMNEGQLDNRFVNHIYAFNDLIKGNNFINLADSVLFGYSFFFIKSKTVSVIVYYAGLFFVTNYIYDKEKYIFIGDKPLVIKKLIQKIELKEEACSQFQNIVRQLDENVNPELQKKIRNYYEKNTDTLEG